MATERLEEKWIRNDMENQENMEMKEEKRQKKGYIVPKWRIDPIARVLLIGVYDDNNILSTFRGMRYIVKSIWEFSLDYNGNYWRQFLEIEPICQKYIGQIHFPKPQDININMMPFIMAKDFAKTKLPHYLKEYYNNAITTCLAKDKSQLNKIGYLTIQESFVDKGCSQRRPGLHIEFPGCGGHTKGVTYPAERNYGGWGGGYEDIPIDGIYMASSVDNTCFIWNCKVITTTKDGREIIGHLGDIEHLRNSLPNMRRRACKTNEIYWLTDKTPHEVVAMQECGYRQFFRLVTHKVAIWYEQHSTKNPNGVLPARKTKIIKGNKFEKNVSNIENDTGCSCSCQCL